MIIVIILLAFFIAFFVYYLSFRFPNFLMFFSIFVNVISLLVIINKFGNMEFLKGIIR